MMFPELRGRKSRGDFGNPEATGNTEAGVGFQRAQDAKIKRRFFYVQKNIHLRNLYI
jgi:hypothetical protein